LDQLSVGVVEAVVQKIHHNNGVSDLPTSSSLQVIVEEAVEVFMTEFLADAAPRTVIQLAALAIEGLSWEGLMEAAKKAGIKPSDNGG
jgi:hypothetical protein